MSPENKPEGPKRINLSPDELEKLINLAKEKGLPWNQDILNSEVILDWKVDEQITSSLSILPLRNLTESELMQILESAKEAVEHSKKIIDENRGGTT